MNSILRNKILRYQQNEITEYFVYLKLARASKDRQCAEILEKISQEELTHYEFFRGVTGEEIKPDKLKLFIYVLVSKLLGLNFGLKMMENGEDLAQDAYAELKEISPRIDQIMREEEGHEYELINLIDEERLKYISSVVLGLNDALVELTASLAGFTLALQNTRLIGIVGLITGIAASMSMAASEYLSTKHEETEKNPLKASVYTGITYIGTVILLIVPYFLFKNIFFSLGLVVVTALLIIFVFTFYISVAKGLNFKKRFAEMAGLSLSVAAITFFIGLAIRRVFGIDV